MRFHGNRASVVSISSIIAACGSRRRRASHSGAACSPSKLAAILSCRPRVRQLNNQRHYTAISVMPNRTTEQVCRQSRGICIHSRCRKNQEASYRTGGGEIIPRPYPPLSVAVRGFLLVVCSYRSAELHRSSARASDRQTDRRTDRKSSQRCLTLATLVLAAWRSG